MYTPDDDDVLIQNAAASGDLQLLQELEAKIGDADDFHRRCEICKDYWGRTGLHFAASKGMIQICKFLLAAGANPNLVTTFSDNDNNNLKPIEQAVCASNLDAVRILFPLTERIPSYPDWSIHGMMNYFRTEAAKTKREQRRNAYFRFADQEGKNAVKRKDYATAVKWFSEAIYIEPSDARLKSNRSICWANLNEGAFALYDAEECVELRPDWAKAHYRAGVAWMLLKSYLMASRAFQRARMLDPGNDEIYKALGEAVVAATRQV